MRFAVLLAVRLLRASRLLVALLTAFAATRALAQVAVLGTSASTTESTGSASSKAMSFTVPAGNNRLLVVTSTGGGNSVNVPSVTFNGTGMTQAVETSSGSGERTSIWYLALGSSGSGTTANVVVTYNTNYLFNITATAFSGVDQSTPVSGATSGVSSTLNVSSASGDMVIDAIGGGGAGSSVGAGQTLQASNNGIVFGDVDARVSTEPGASSVTMSWTGYSYVYVHAGVNLRQAVTVPTLTSATYDASTGALAVTATGMTTGDTIAVAKLTLTGEGGSTYTLTSSNVTASSATAFSVTLNATDRAAVNLIFNRNGTTSTGSTTYNLAAADDWNANVTSGDTSDPTNGVTVSNVAVPTVTSATYDASTGVLVVTGTGLLSRAGSTNDIDVSKLTLTGESGGTYTLTTTNVEVSSGTQFTVALNGTDKAAVNLLLNQNGTSSVGGTTYNLAAAEDWAAGAHAAVTVADLTGNGVTVSNADSTPPTVSGVTSSTANGTYKAGDSISIQVNFSENVTVTGTPQLTLETGTSDQTINYASGSGTSTLTFTYTVQAGDTASDLDYVSTSALALNGGTIRDAAGNNATLTLASPGAANSLGANKALVVDTTAPTVSGVTSSTANGTYKAGDSISIQVNFSESVTVTGTPQLTLETGTIDQTINYASGSGTSTLTFTYTVQAGDTASDLDYVSTSALALNGGTIRDAAGNNATLTLASPGAANSLGANKALVVDTTAPTVSGVTSSTANGTYKAGDTISIQVSFSESVTVTGTPQLTLETGTTDQTINYASGSGTSTLMFSYTVQADDTAADLDYVSTSALALNGGTIRDAAGNNATLTLASPGAANSLGANKALVVDTTAPVVSSVVRHTPSAASVTVSSVVFRATFSEPVTGVDTADFTATVTGISATVASVSPVSASIYDVTVNGLAGVGTLRLDVASGGLADAAGNTLSTAYSAGEVYTVDTSVQFPIVANFDGADNTSLTNAGWLLAGDTTATGDRLRLTRAVNALAGTAIFNQAFAAAVGVNVQFDFEMSGGTGADGLAFFLVDGAQAAPTSGGTGPSFGYVYSSTGPGASLAYLGVGFDLWGNFTNTMSFHDGISAVENPNRIALRGPATIASSCAAHHEYDYVVGSAVNYSVAGTRKVNLTITPTGRITLQISADAGATWASIYNDFDFAATAAFSGYTQPATLKLGFGASTGGSNNLHAIDNVVVRKPAEHALAFTTTPSGTQDVGATVSYTLTATNNGWNDDPAVQLAYTVPATLTDVAWSYSVDGGTAITGTSSTINETFALAATKSAVLTVQGRITAGAAGTTIAHAATLTPSSAFGDLAPTNNVATASTAVSATPTITSALTAGATYGTAFGGYTITATNTPTSFAATGLPAGLVLASATGVISGTPTQTGTFNVSLTGTNGGGTGAASTLVLTVAKAPLAVTADSASRGYGAANPALTVSYSGFVNGDTSASLGTAPTASTTANASSGIGTYPITVAGGVSANYTFTYLDGVLTVNRASALVTLSSLNASYTGSPQAVSVTTFPAGLTVAVTYDGSGVAPSAPGSYGVVATVDDANYQGFASGFLTIGRMPVTIQIAASATTYDGQPKPVGVTTTPSGLAPRVTYNGSTAIPTQAGTYAVVAAVDTPTHAGSASGTLTIAKAAQTIAFAELAGRDANADPFALSATASSGLPVAFAVKSGPALLSGNTVTLTGVAGPVTITATQDGDANHLPAPGVARTFTVNAAGARVFIGAMTSRAITTPVGDIGAVLPPTGNTGHMVIVAPGVNVNLAFDFTLRPDGTFEWLTVGDGAPTPLGDSGRAVAAAPRPLTLRGRLDGNVLTGRFDELDLAFEIAVQSGGATTAAAGYYTSSPINSAAGSTYTVVGHHGEVIALAAIGDSTLAGRTTLDPDGSFRLTAGGVALSGAIDVSTTKVAGTLSRPGLPEVEFAGAAVTTRRTDRMVNLSSRARIGPVGERTLITGFVIGGTASKRLLLRAVGPALAGYGVGGALKNPRLQLFDAARGLILENDDWSGADTAAAFAATGAFALPSGAGDAAILVTLAPGAYTMHVIDGGENGVALAEIYDASPNPNAEYQRLINISSRGTVDSGEGALIGGFVITGNLPKRVLVRGVGPSLAAHGVSGALPNPRLGVYAGAAQVAQNDDWETPQVVTASQIAATAADIAAASRVAGAFTLVAGSRDAALVVTLVPGAYTAQVTSADGSVGVALVEVYELPE